MKLCDIMRLSESLRRGIMKVGTGGILNRFKAKGRRDVLFPEEILANYILECERAGFGDEIEEIGQVWMNMVLNYLLPSAFKRLPLESLFLNFAKKIWLNIGLMDDITIEKKGNKIYIETKREYVSRTIGKNRFASGAFMGILNIVYDSHFKLLESVQSRDLCEYIYETRDKKWETVRTKKNYEKLNHRKGPQGFDMKEALRRRILTLGKGNRTYFRGKTLVHLENTFTHLFSNRGLLMERVAEISHKHFDILEEAPAEKKLNLLKSLLQITGWGSPRILIKNRKRLQIEIRNPPFGLQTDKDNWLFLAETILGYLWHLDRNYDILSLRESGSLLIIEFHLRKHQVNG